ncbi:MAG TPA: hypothetical protein VF503_04665 [Sphingobium sp.]|uniref:hypothetical protein n=1 Tax=Sphingobium sp. TaxID=1912891 RepID=UPI002ED3F207
MAAEEEPGETARLIALSIHRKDDGTPGYRLDNPFGQSVQVMPRPPAFRATVTFEWDGAMPEEIGALVERARALGIDIGD